MYKLHHKHDIQNFDKKSFMKQTNTFKATCLWNYQQRSNYSWKPKEITPKAILGTKRADELIAAQMKQNLKAYNPIMPTTADLADNNKPRPILGGMYKLSKCNGDIFGNMEEMESDNTKNSKEINDNSNGFPIPSMCFTKKHRKSTNTDISASVFPNTHQSLAKDNSTLYLNSFMFNKTEIKKVNSSNSKHNNSDDEVNENPFDMNSMLKVALQIMKTTSLESRGFELNSIDSPEVMAVRQRLLSMAIWNNNKEIYDESFVESDDDNPMLESCKAFESLTLNSSVYFANSKFLSAPPANALPMPPQKWLDD